MLSHGEYVHTSHITHNGLQCLRHSIFSAGPLATVAGWIGNIAFLMPGETQPLRKPISRRFVYIHVYVPPSLSLSRSLSLSLSIYVYLDIYACAYVCTYIYTHIYTYMCLYTCTYICMGPVAWSCELLPVQYAGEYEPGPCWAQLPDARACRKMQSMGPYLVWTLLKSSKLSVN